MGAACSSPTRRRRLSAAVGPTGERSRRSSPARRCAPVRRGGPARRDAASDHGGGRAAPGGALADRLGAAPPGGEGTGWPSIEESPTSSVPTARRVGGDGAHHRARDQEPRWTPIRLSVEHLREVWRRGSPDFDRVASRRWPWSNGPSDRRRDELRRAGSGGRYFLSELRCGWPVSADARQTPWTFARPSLRETAAGRSARGPRRIPAGRVEAEPGCRVAEAGRGGCFLARPRGSHNLVGQRRSRRFGERGGVGVAARRGPFVRRRSRPCEAVGRATGPTGVFLHGSPGRRASSSPNYTSVPPNGADGARASANSR
jgi:hypothetical protein